MAEEQYGQYASPEQQGFYESGFTLEDQAEPSQQQQQQWSQGPSSYYSAPPPPPHQQHVYSAEAYGQQSKLLLASKLHVCTNNVQETKIMLRVWHGVLSLELCTRTLPRVHTSS